MGKGRQEVIRNPDRVYLIHGMMVNRSACLGCTWVMGVGVSRASKARFRTLDLIL